MEKPRLKFQVSVRHHLNARYRPRKKNENNLPQSDSRKSKRVLHNLIDAKRQLRAQHSFGHSVCRLFKRPDQASSGITNGPKELLPMLRKTFVTTLVASLALLLGQADAQIITYPQTPVVIPGQTFPGQIVQGPIVTPGQVFPGQTVIPAPIQTFPGQVIPGTTFPGQIVYPPNNFGRPSVPVGVTPNTVTGWNPQTGGLNTTNSQVNNTFYDPGRNMSQFNNSRRWVRRPVFGTAGQVTGYQEGFVWNNTFTGQEHGNLQSYTPNQQGGVHQGNVAYSMAPGHEPPTTPPQTQTQSGR